MRAKSDRSGRASSARITAARRSRKPSRADARIALASAYHEAGHAVAAWLEGLSVRSASIVPAGPSGGEVTHANPLRRLRVRDPITMKIRSRIEKVIRICLAGPIAQRYFDPRSWRRHHGALDHLTAAELVAHMASSRREADAYVTLLAVQTEDMLARRSIWRMVERVAAALRSEGRLSRRRIHGLLRRSPGRKTAPRSRKARRRWRRVGAPR